MSDPVALESFIKAKQEAATKAAADATTKVTGALSWWLYRTNLFWLVVVLGMAITIAGQVLGWWNIGPKTAAGGQNDNAALFISSAKITATSPSSASTPAGSAPSIAFPIDITSFIQGQVSSAGGGTSLPSFIVSCQSLQLTPEQCNLVTASSGVSLTVTWYQGYGDTFATTIPLGSTFPALPSAPDGSSTGPAIPIEQFTQRIGGPQSSKPGPTVGSPTVFTRAWNYMTGSSSSGDLLGPSHDAATSATILASSAPLSSEKQGGYGMQWWMFVKDWNYGYGKKKSVIKRSDPTLAGVNNPHISLHPTDNTLQISVSIFPSGEGAGKSEPAPAGHAGATDDVFVCEVPGIPLQSWFSVSTSVFGRNLDVYLNGQLVKSCLLPGVPKPASGDIQMTPEGGFSGKICGFYHFARMLTPNDAALYNSRGCPCPVPSDSTALSSTTGYSVKFGVYDTLGKQIQSYAF